MFDITQILLVWVTVCPSFRLSHIINWAHHDNGNQEFVDTTHLFTPKKKCDGMASRHIYAVHGWNVRRD